jgi:DNA-binding transcriptional LysR family regulator
MITVLDLRLLAALEAVVDEGTFAQAAARTGYTQSSLSQQIAALERSVGGRVFDRPGGPRRVRLTALGRLVLTHARELRERADEATDAIDRFWAGGGRVDIGTFQTVTNVLLPTVVRRLREEQPGCDVRLLEDEAEEPRLAGLDLVFYDGPPAAGVDGRLVLEDDHLLLAPPGRFPSGPVDVAALDGLPVVALPAICDHGRVEGALAAIGIRLDVVFRTADNQAVGSMVRAGLGCAVMPALAIGDATGISLHPLEPRPATREIYLHWQGVLSPLASRVVALTEEVAAGLASAWVRPATPAAATSA